MQIGALTGNCEELVADRGGQEIEAGFAARSPVWTGGPRGDDLAGRRRSRLNTQYRPDGDLPHLLASMPEAS
jgi:hypothetical protein